MDAGGGAELVGHDGARVEALIGGAVVDCEWHRDERNARTRVEPLLHRALFIARVPAAERHLEFLAEMERRLSKDRVTVDFIIRDRGADLRPAAEQRHDAAVAEPELVKARHAIALLEERDYPDQGALRR